jgi:hypothetical protein
MAEQQKDQSEIKAQLLRHIRTMNIRNADFWRSENQLVEKRVNDDILHNFALETLASEELRGLPIRLRTDLPEALQRGALLQQRLQTRQAHLAAKAKRPDALQGLIAEILKQKPRITWKELLRELKEDSGPAGVVISVGNTKIEFMDRGRVEEASISGLKDRLSRARRSLESR